MAHFGLADKANRYSDLIDSTADVKGRFTNSTLEHFPKSTENRDQELCELNRHIWSLFLRFFFRAHTVEQRVRAY